MKVRNEALDPPMIRNEESPPPNGQTYDEIYIESWNATVKQCEEKLEPSDYQVALEVKNAVDFRRALDKLQEEFSIGAPQHVLRLLYPTLHDYDKFAHAFVKMMSKKVEVSVLWGLLFLVIRLSLESGGTIEHIIRNLEEISYQLRRLNACTRTILDYTQIKRDAMDIHRDMVFLWLNVIMTFRSQRFDTTSQSTLQSLTNYYEDAMRRIGAAVVRVEKIVELAERKMHLADMELLRQKIEQFAVVSADNGELPCCVLPVAENSAFFGRENILTQIDEHLQPTDTTSGLKSLAIHGLGGVGKTQIALAYAYAKRGELDALFWIPAQSTLDLQRGFSAIAMALKLPNTDPGSHKENMIKIMGWLQKTSAKWLVIYDNVENHAVLSDCWPAFDHGAVLITTRNHMVASQPVQKGLEITEFSVEDGAAFIRSLLPNRIHSPEEDQASEQMSQELRGYALAISQMCAYIRARGMKLQAFMKFYKKCPKKLHREKKPGWKYIGYDYGIDTVWDISFSSLDESAAALLELLSFILPDNIPLSLMEDLQETQFLSRYDFLTDEMSLGDAIERLTTTALARLDVITQSLSVHRLVQAETLFRTTQVHRQEAFEAAITLLHTRIPHRTSPLTKEAQAKQGDGLLPHAVKLANEWYDSQELPEPLEPTLKFCDLMLNIIRFVNDTTNTGVMSLAMKCAIQAYKKLPHAEKDILFWADCLGLSSLVETDFNGDFESAERLAREALQIQTELGHTNDYGVSKLWQYIALACDSAGKHDEARIWLDKLSSWFDEMDKEDKYFRIRLQTRMNSSRNHYCVGDYEKAKDDLAVAYAGRTALNSAFHTAYMHQTYSSLFIRTGQLNLAREHIEHAQKALIEDGIGTNMMISALCAIRATQVALHQHRAEDAVREAEKAFALYRVHNGPINRQARAAHYLHQALSLVPEKAEEAATARREAQRLRSLLPVGRTDLNDESDMAFEMLVPIYQR